MQHGTMLLCSRDEVWWNKTEALGVATVLWGGFQQNHAKFPFTRGLQFLHLQKEGSTSHHSRVWGLQKAEFGSPVFAVAPVWMRFILAALRGKVPYSISSPLSHPAFHARLFYLENMTACGKQYLQFNFFVVVPADVKLLGFIMRV